MGDTGSRVGVPGHRFGQWQLAPHPVDRRSHQGGQRQVRVDVPARYPALDPQRRPVPDQPQRAGPVVWSPRDGGRREAAGYVSLVGVHGGREQQRHFPEPGLQAGQHGGANRRQTVGAVPSHHGFPAGSAGAKRQMNMAGVPLGRVHLGHERQAVAVPGRDLLGAGLVDDMLVRGGQRVVVPERDLVLAEVALALGRLDRQSGAGHAVADVAQQRLDPAGAEHRVVHVVPVGGHQPSVTGVPGLLVRVLEHDEFEFGSGHGGPAEVASRR